MILVSAVHRQPSHVDTLTLSERSDVLSGEWINNLSLLSIFMHKPHQGFHHTIAACLVDRHSETVSGELHLWCFPSGSSAGIRMAMHLTRALGTVLLKSTVSTSGDSSCPNQVSWAELANDIVVNEKTLVGSR